MALPKAILCILGDEPACHPAEAELRAVGFATFAVTWKELDAQQNGWMQILPPLNDPTVSAWVIAGKCADFTDEIRSEIMLLTLALARPKPPLTAFVLTDPGKIQDVPYAMGHVRIFPAAHKYAAKLMAARMQPAEFQKLPFHVKAHLDPLVGAWLEIGPPDNELWQGFMIGVTVTEVLAFGVGPKGALPRKSVLQFPQLGIKGNIGSLPFSACAAKNELDPETSCYIRIESAPSLVFCADYPEEDPCDAKKSREAVQLEFL